MAISKLNPSAGGIPFGNTAGRPTAATGKLYSNGETARLELYTETGWQNIVQETPGVSSVTGSYLESTNSGTFTISGTNFVSGCYATAIGTNGVGVDASTTTFNSLVQVTAQFTGLSNQYEPYDIKITNPSNLFGMLPDSLYINANPTWVTSAGSLGSFAEQVNATIYALSVSDESTITYSLASESSLPSGVTLSSSGVISGTLPNIASNTTYTFTVNATDSLNPTISRTFSFISNAAPTWVTTAGSLGTFLNNTSMTTSALSATDPSDTVTYALASGSSLPAGVSLNSASGVISGTLPVIASNTIYTFTINATDGINIVPREFSISSRIPFSTEYLVVAGGGGGAGRHAGGGGGGGMRSGSLTLSEFAVTVTVGSGGLGAANNEGSAIAYNGENSVFSSITSLGGGRGGCNGFASAVGGSGGGGNDGANATGSAGTSGQGNSGGNGGGTYAGGAGGGAGANGNNSSGGTGGAGGAGLANSITGTSVTYAGGGGGGGWENNSFGAGGSGGGGAGSAGNGTAGNGTRGIKATSGTANTGGGGGGGGVEIGGVTGGGGNGGSGVVVIAYLDSLPAITTIPNTLTYDQPTRSGYRVYRFTAGSGTVTF